MPPRLLSVAEIVHPAVTAEPDTARALVALTDEELLAALGEDPVATLVRAPFLGELPETEKTFAMRSGLRSLVARGLVQAPEMSAAAPDDSAAEPGDGDVPQLDTADELADVLTFYRTAARVALIDLPVPGDRRRQFSVLLPSATLSGHALVEEVTHGGLHGFSVLGRDELADAFWRGAVEADRTPLLAGTAAVEIAVVSQGAEEPTVVLIGLSPTREWQVRTRYGVEGEEAVSDGDVSLIHRVLDAVLSADGDIATAAGKPV